MLRDDCPRCGSKNIRMVLYMGAECVLCNDCGYDMSAEFDAESGSRSSQKAKGSFSPYKVGGKNRTSKTKK